MLALFEKKRQYKMTNMSKSKFDSDGFQIVTSKRFSKNKSTTVPQKATVIEKEEIKINLVKSKQQIQCAIEDLKGSEYFGNLNKSVSTLLQSKKVVEVVCFGLGHVGECIISRYQLGLLLCIKELYSPKKSLVHDPIFYTSECELLKEFGLDVIEKNNEGSYIISEQDLTLVYLPHCPKQLTNNFLWSNWGTRLRNCILICNSLSLLIESQPSRILSETVPYIFKIYPHTTEITLANNFKYKDIFNDTSIHTFEEKNLNKVEKDFWVKSDKPKYNNTEEFITCLMIEKLTV